MFRRRAAVLSLLLCATSMLWSRDGPVGRPFATIGDIPDSVEIISKMNVGERQDPVSVPLGDIAAAALSSGQIAAAKKAIDDAQKKHKLSDDSLQAARGSLTAGSGLGDGMQGVLRQIDRSPGLEVKVQEREQAIQYIPGQVPSPAIQRVLDDGLPSHTRLTAVRSAVRLFNIAKSASDLNEQGSSAKLVVAYINLLAAQGRIDQSVARVVIDECKDLKNPSWFRETGCWIGSKLEDAGKLILYGGGSINAIGLWQFVMLVCSMAFTYATIFGIDFFHDIGGARQSLIYYLLFGSMFLAGSVLARGEAGLNVLAYLAGAHLLMIFASQFFPETQQYVATMFNTGGEYPFVSFAWTSLEKLSSGTAATPYEYMMNTARGKR